MKMRNGYMSAAASTVLLVIAGGTIVYVTLKVKKWIDSIS